MRCQVVAVGLALLAVSGCGNGSTERQLGPVRGQVSGTVTEVGGPAVLCSGPKGARSGCPGSPVPVPHGTTVALRDARGREVVTVQVGPDGKFAFSAPAGAFTARADLPGGGVFGRGRAVPVTVAAGRVVRLDLTVDNGMR